MSTAATALEEGRLQDAEQACALLLTERAGDPEAWHLAAQIAMAAGRGKVAAARLAQAADLAPDTDTYHLALAELLVAMGRSADAIDRFRRALAIAPRQPRTLNSLGNALLTTGDFDAARAAYQAAVEIDPGYALAQCNLGLAHLHLENWESALDPLAEAIRLSPGLVPAHLHRAIALTYLRRYEDATAAIETAVRLAPQDPAIHYTLGRIHLGQGRARAAAESFRTALAFNPDLTEGYRALAEALATTKEDEEATVALQMAVDRLPRQVSLRCDLAMMLHSQGRSAEAIAALEEALRLEPRSRQAHLAIAAIHQGRGDLPAALATIRRLPPEHPDVAGLQYSLGMSLCDWTDHDMLARLLKEGIGMDAGDIQPSLTYMVTGLTMDDQCRATRAFVKKHLSSLDASIPTAVPQPAAKIKLGYLSGDYCTHPIARLMAGIFEHHDRARFETYAYSLGGIQDEFTQHIRERVDRWIDLSAHSDGDAAQRIRDDQIEILVDLSGFTGVTRFGIPARRPAAVQVLYHQGGTSGSNCMDYVLTDTVTAPPGRFAGFTESFAYFPDTFVNLAEIGEAPAGVRARSEYGLAENAFVFCAFSTPYKITPAIFDIWMRLLRNVPEAVLWLREFEPVAIVNLRTEAAKHGVSPDRLIFAPRLPRDAYIARYHCADLFLDTLPYTCCSTAADVLWAGLPILTFAGETYVGRMCASLVTSVGLPEMICTSLEEYYDKALALAQNRAALRRLHDRVAAGRKSSVLFDAARFTRQLEDIYVEMSRRSRAGETPTTIGP